MKPVHPIEETSAHRVARVLGKVPLFGTLASANYVTIALVVMALSIAVAGFIAGWAASSFFGGYAETLQQLGAP